MYLAILSIAFILRIRNLGYSDFQGDEVSAQNFLFGEQNFLDFLLTRTIGPGQYIISAISNFLFKNFGNIYFWTRLPFCLAGFLAIFYTHKFVKKAASKKAANITIFFMGLSGLLIAFSRIIQYQSFILLFSVVAIYNFWKFLESEKPINLIVLSIVSGVGLLFHYDALSFIVPVMLILFSTKRYKKLFEFSFITAAIAIAFYLPFILSQTFAETISYLVGGRISYAFSHDSLFYSLKLSQIYHSKEFIVLIFLGAAGWALSIQKQVDLFGKRLLAINLILITLRIINQTRTAILVYSSSILAAIFIFHYLKTRKKFKFEEIITTWFLVGFFTYGIFISMPLTHIYTFFIPLFILIALQYEKVINKFLVKAAFGIVLVSAVSFNYQAFLENNVEYPWEEKKYIFGKMYQGIANGERVTGIFGFPYQRDWMEISASVDGLNKETGALYYNTNEKYRIAKYYLQGYKFTELEKAQIVIIIKNSQNFAAAPELLKQPMIQTDKYLIYYYEDR